MKIIRDIISIMMSKGIKQVIDMVFIMVLSRVLTQGDYGTYKQINLIVQTISPFVILGLPTALSYFISKNKNKTEEKSLVVQTFITLNLLALGAVVIVLLNLNYIANSYSNPEIENYMVVYLIFLFIEIASGFYPEYFVATSKIGLLSKFTIIYSVSRLICLFISILAFNSNLMSFIICICIIDIIKYIFIVIEILGYYKDFKFELKFPELWEEIKYSIPVGLSNIIGTVFKLLDQNMVSFWFSPIEYSIFVNGAFEIPFINVITGSITSVFLPSFTRMYINNEKEKILYIWKQSMVYTSILLIPIMVYLVCFPETFIVFLFSERYIESSSIFRIYQLTLPIRAVNFGTLFLVSGNQKIVLKSNIINIILGIILNIIFIKNYGYKGAAIATVIGTYILTLIYIYYIKKVYNVSFNKIFFGNKLLKILGVSIICILPIYFINREVLTNIYIYILVSIIYFLVCVVFFLILKVFNLSELKNILSSYKSV